MDINANNLSVNLKSSIKEIFIKADKNHEQREKSCVVEDRVDLSFRAKEIQKAKANLNNIPEIRDEKVAILKEKIKKGIYKIDGEKIAFKMLKESVENDDLTGLDIRV